MRLGRESCNHRMRVLLIQAGESHKLKGVGRFSRTGFGNLWPLWWQPLPVELAFYLRPLTMPWPRAKTDSFKQDKDEYGALLQCFFASYSPKSISQGLISFFFIEFRALLSPVACCEFHLGRVPGCRVCPCRIPIADRQKLAIYRAGRPAFSLVGLPGTLGSALW